jgi:ribosomal protein S18 acetylase RimI-like enzyme
MDLPVIKIQSPPASSADLLRFYHKCEATWSEGASSPTELAIGTAFVNPQFDRLGDANRLAGAMLPEASADAEALIGEVESHFASAGCRCLRWTMNPTATDAQTRPIIAALERRGLRRIARDVMHLNQRVDLRYDAPPDLQIIPARASYRHTQQSLGACARDEWHEPQLADAMIQHLDDPRYDLLLALRGGQPVGRGGVLTVGDVGLIKDIYVAPAHRGQGLGRLMTLRCLELCARSLFRHVLLSVEPQNPAAEMYRRIGFAKFGEYVEWAATPPA